MPMLGILSCLMLMFSLPAENWVRLFVWLAIGLVIYFAYGRKHSAAARCWPKQLTCVLVNSRLRTANAANQA